MNLKVFLNLVKHLKLQVDTALSGQKCLELVCQNKYDIIFMDHMMPEMDGIVTLEHMKEHVCNKNEDTPVIMLTANALSGMKEMYLSKGFTDYLSKPIDGIKLEEKIERYLPTQKVLHKEASQEKINDKVDAETQSDIKETPLEHLKNAVKDINIDKALQYCAGSEEFYLECLKDYCNKGRKAIIEQAYAAEDWNRYGIEVHALKSTSRTLGFEALGDMAESMQAAAEAQDAPYIREKHEKLLEKFEHILKVIAECV